MSTGTQQFWTEFIDLYRSLPVLWNKNLKCYDNNPLLNEAYDALAEKLSEIEDDVDHKKVKKRIKALRSQYEKDFFKLKEQAKNSDEKSLYVTGLWYFNHFKFLDEFISKGNTPQDEKLHKLIHERCVIVKRNSCLPAYIRPCFTTPSHDVMTDLKADEETMNNGDKIYARYLDSQLRDLEAGQHILAKAAIEEIIRQAKLGQLNRHSLVINEKQY